MEVIDSTDFLVIQGCVQHYAWGGHQFIPHLLGQKNSENLPFAELWFGTHQGCPARLDNGQTLLEVLQTSPEAQESGGNSKQPISYLCKVLDVKNMLSIQLHPSKKTAEEGFAMEESAKIPIDAFHRSFKDDNHKPELMLALSPFYLLHGFKSDEELTKIAQLQPRLSDLVARIEQFGLKNFYNYWMTADQVEINDHLADLVAYLQGQESIVDKMHPDFWALRALHTFEMEPDIDRGLLSIYLFNLVCLQPGEVIFQGAGVPHAYLEGQNIEVMSNSDNVIRGGLTPKYIDHQALLQMINFEHRHIDILTAQEERPNMKKYTPPVSDFQLTVWSSEVCGKEQAVPAKGLLFSLNESLTLQSGVEEIELQSGQALFMVKEGRVKVKSPFEKPVYCITGRK